MSEDDIRPQVTPKSWYLDPEDQQVSNTFHIVKAFQQKQIGVEEIIRKLEKLNEEESVIKIVQNSSNFCKYSNLAGLFESYSKSLSSRTAKSPSMLEIREMLAYRTLRSYLINNFIKNG